ncbi:MAG: hypothetical protein WCO60_12155 [Verrucomicrobiota bacterium]
MLKTIQMINALIYFGKTRLSIIVLLGAVISTAMAQEDVPKDRFGLTTDQILSMGVIKWRDFYLKKAGADAFHEKMAFSFYTDCLEEEINKRLSKLSTKEQTFFRQLNLYLSKILDSRIGVEQSISGGSIWPSIQTSSGTSVSQLILDLICGTAKTAKTKEADIWNAVKDVQQQITEALSKSKSDSGYFVTFEQANFAKQKFDSMNTELKALSSLLESRPPSERSSTLMHLKDIITLKLGE